MFSELVKIENNQVVTTSLKIADVFEIQHKDLLDKIRLLSAETSAGLIISDYNPQFVESSYLDNVYIRHNKHNMDTTYLHEQQNLVC